MLTFNINGYDHLCRKCWQWSLMLWWQGYSAVQIQGERRWVLEHRSLVSWTMILSWYVCCMASLAQSSKRWLWKNCVYKPDLTFRWHKTRKPWHLRQNYWDKMGLFNKYILAISKRYYSSFFIRTLVTSCDIPSWRWAKNNKTSIL